MNREERSQAIAAMIEIFESTNEEPSQSVNFGRLAEAISREVGVPVVVFPVFVLGHTPTWTIRGYEVPSVGSR